MVFGIMARLYEVAGGGTTGFLAGKVDSIVAEVIILVMEVPIAQVKLNRCELNDRVENGESLTIARHRRPLAQLVRMPGSCRRGRWRCLTMRSPTAGLIGMRR